MDDDDEKKIVNMWNCVGCEKCETKTTTKTRLARSHGFFLHVYKCVYSKNDGTKRRKKVIAHHSLDHHRLIGLIFANALEAIISQIVVFFS